jgi:hypothetical protein
MYDGDTSTHTTFPPSDLVMPHSVPMRYDIDTSVPQSDLVVSQGAPIGPLKRPRHDSPPVLTDPQDGSGDERGTRSSPPAFTDSQDESKDERGAKKSKKGVEDILAIANHSDQYPKWFLKQYAPQLAWLVRSAKIHIWYISLMVAVSPYGPDRTGRRKSAEIAYEFAKKKMLSVEDGGYWSCSHKCL